MNIRVVENRFFFVYEKIIGGDVNDWFEAQRLGMNALLAVCICLLQRLELYGETGLL